MNEKVIWNYLLKATGNAAGTAAIMGNLMAESSLNPKCATGKKKTANYVNDADTGRIDFAHDSVAFGLVQWCYYTRKQRLMDLAKSRGKSVGDLELQLEYLVKEMSENYKTVWSSVTTGNSIRAISDVVMLKYEKPAGTGEAAKKKRAEYGQKYYDQFAGKAEPEKPAESVKKVVATSGVRIRAGDSTAYGQVGSLKKGQSLDYVGTSEDTGWYAVRMSDRVGWVCKDYAEVRS